MNDDTNEPHGSQIRLRLTTREQDLLLNDIAPILVPTSFRRYQLSTLVNGLLEREKAIPLEFLVNGSYLRTTVEDYITENGISAETVLTVEYVRARIPPQYVASFEHDDWVSDVHVLDASSAKTTTQGRILTSSYDGRIRVWNASSQVLGTSSAMGEGGHGSFVKSARFLSPSQIASASFDRTIRVWKYVEEKAGSSQIQPQIELYGHKASVESICAHMPSHRMLSASADHSVGLWSTRKSDAPAVDESLIPKAVNSEGKRRKLNPSVTVPQRGPLSLMQQHTAPVSQAIFDVKDATVGYSTSLDHTVRTWDLVTSALVDTRTTNHALYCIEQMAELQLLACGSAGRDIKMVDPRVSATSVTAMTLKGHKNHVVTLARDPNSGYGLVSGSHDGTCRVWDVRSTKNSKDGVTGQSMYTITRHSLNGAPTPATGERAKVFGVSWDRELGILSAGEDKQVQINSTSSMS